MTNEEIVKAVIYLTPKKVRWDTSETHNLMDLARKDEREKVIGEIKKIWNNKIFGRYRGIDFVIDKIFKSELNSLKQC